MYAMIARHENPTPQAANPKPLTLVQGLGCRVLGLGSLGHTVGATARLVVLL